MRKEGEGRGEKREERREKREEGREKREERREGIGKKEEKARRGLGRCRGPRGAAQKAMKSYGKSYYSPSISTSKP